MPLGGGKLTKLGTWSWLPFKVKGRIEDLIYGLEFEYLLEI